MIQPTDKARIAVVGAGLSGLACADALTERGHSVRVFDKGRAPGGRTSTRRADLRGVELSFDHGAQYFTVRDAELAERVRHWEEKGVVKLWAGRIAVLGTGGSVESYSHKPRYVGAPGMNAICQHLASDQDVHCGVTVGRIVPVRAGVQVLDLNGRTLGEFDFAVATAPPSQTAALLADAAPAIAARAASVVMKPCWAVMAAFESRLDVPYDGAFINEGPLSWVARTSSKPARTESPDRWVLHGSAPWSVDHLEDAAESATSQLLDAFFEAIGRHPLDPLWATAHRWRFALAENPLDEGCLFDASVGIAACGDWAHGNRVEGALLSGLAAARRVDHAASTRR